MILGAKPVWPGMTTGTLYVKSSYAMTFYEKKTDLTCAWRFLRTNKNPPFGDTVHKICVIYVSLRRYSYVAKVINNGRMEVKNSLVRK